jgi:hypothetical protein
MITLQNYFDQTSSLVWSDLPAALSKGNALVNGASHDNWNAYHTNENIKRVVEAYFLKLSDYLEKNAVVIPEKKIPAKISVSNAVKQKSVPKEKVNPTISPEQEDDEATQIERIDTDVQFIKRYAAMHGKVRSQAQVLTLLQGLQRAILEHRIDKDSPYAKEITLMQEQLIKCYEKMGDMVEIKIDSKNLKRYLSIASSQQGMLSIILLKAYVSLHGKRGVKEKAELLLKRIKKAVEQGKVTKTDKYAAKLNDGYTHLKSYIAGDKETLSINRSELNGLLGIVNENLFDQKKSLSGTQDENGPLVVPSHELLSMDFETIGLQGKFYDLIGDPSVGFSAMVYGLPKSGKSTLCLDFAKHLAEHHGKVLFCAVEEGFGYTLKEKIERLKASHPNLFITDRIPQDVSAYQFVFIDSVSKAGIDISDIELLRKQHSETSFIFIYHTTKEGRFKGVNTHAHEVDVIIEVGKGDVKATGRFNAGGRMEM